MGTQSTPEGFDRFWAAYPLKVGKLAAIKAYAKARTLATEEEIVAGIGRYVAGKPEYADWCHPRTFLSQGRWMDEYGDGPTRERPFTAQELADATTVRRKGWGRCQHDPECASYGDCIGRIALHLRGKVAS